MEAIGEARVEWMTSSDIQASDEEVFNYTTVLPIKGECKIIHVAQNNTMKCSEHALGVLDTSFVLDMS